jgi:hypothetical protein
MLYSQPESSNATPPLAPLQQLYDFSQVEHFFDFGLRDGVPKGPGRLGRSDVEQRAGKARAGDAVDHHPINGGKRSIPVRPNSVRRSTATVGRDDVNPIAGIVEDLVEVGRRPVRQHRTGTTSKRGCDQLAFPAEDWMAEGINALVNPVEPPDSFPFASDTLSEAKLVQLPSSNNSMLRLSQLLNQVIINGLVPPTGRFRPA